MDKNDKIIELLDEILLWMKYDYLDTKRKLIETLDTEDKIIAYELSDGYRSTNDIAQYVDVSHQTVYNWWNKWFEFGLIEQTEKYGGGRYKRLCSLTKMGIKVPEITMEE